MIQPVPTARPATKLNPATDYTDGICELPEGYFLFLKFSSHTSCSNACDCPAIEPPDSAINKSEDGNRYYSDRVIGNFEPWNPNYTGLGLLVYGWFEELLYAIEEVPFEVPNSGKPFVGCDPTGVVYVVIGGEALELEPGKSWSSQSVQDRGEGCYETHTLSIGNLGLVEKSHFISDLSARDENVQLDMVTNYYSLDENIAFDILVSGEVNIDFSHFCPFIIEMSEGENWVEVGSCSNFPDFVPEPFPRMPGDFIEISLPLSTIGLDYPYQYELGVGEYRIKFTYTIQNLSHEMYSHLFRVVP
jgi:hypothetical protein